MRIHSSATTRCDNKDVHLVVESPVLARQSVWKFEDQKFWFQWLNAAFREDKPRWTRWTFLIAAKLSHHINLLGFKVPLLRQICCEIVVHEQGQQEVIQHLKEYLSGFPITPDEVESWVFAQFISYGIDREEQFGELLDEQYNVLCQDFELVSLNSEMSLFLNSVLSKIKGHWVKYYPDVHILTDSMVLQGKRYFSGLCSIPMEAQTRDLQPHVVKDAACYVSRPTIGNTDGGDRFAWRLGPRPDIVKTRRRRHVGTSDDTIDNSGLIVSTRSIGTRLVYPRPPPRTIETGASTWAATQPVAPPAQWIFDSGAAVCITGDLSLLTGVHDAPVMFSSGVSGAVLMSDKCGRISGDVNLSGVRYFPGSRVNLICAGLFGRLNCETVQNKFGCWISKNGHVIGGGKLLPDSTYSLDYLDDALLGNQICHDCPRR